MKVVSSVVWTSALGLSSNWALSFFLSFFQLQIVFLLLKKKEQMIISFFEEAEAQKTQIEGNKRAHKQVWATNIKHWVKTEKLKRPWLVQRRALIQSRPLTYKQFKKHKLKSLEWPSPLSKNIPELEVICKEKDENSQKLSGSSGGVFLLIIAHSSIHCSCTPTWCFSASVCATTSAGCATMAIYSWC